MNNHSFKLNHLFSVIIGALIGTIVGKSLIGMWGNWTVFIGPLVGAICFLFISAPKTTVSIIKFSWGSAWRIFVVELSYKRMTRDILIWSRNFLIRLSASIIAGCLVGIALSTSLFSLAKLMSLFMQTQVELSKIQEYDNNFFLFLVITTSILFTLPKYFADDPFIDYFKLAVFYINPIAVLFWACLFVFVFLKVFVPFFFSEFTPALLKLVLRFSIYLQDGLRKHGLILGATSASTGALIGQFSEHLWLGGLIGGGVYCIVHGIVWMIATFAKSFPRQFLYGQ